MSCELFVFNSLFSGAVFGFLETSYSVMESEGGLVIDVELLEGELVYSVSLEISHMDLSTRKSKCLARYVVCRLD